MARTGSGIEAEADDEMMITGMNMYPNPVLSGNQLNLSIPSDGQTEATIMVTNMIGQTVMSQVVAIDEDANEVVLPVENVKPGYYFVTILNGDGKLTRPLVIQ
jgi:hypothetical protein